MRLSQLSQTTERAHSAGLRWSFLLGLGFLLTVGIEEAQGFKYLTHRIFAYSFYAFIASIVLWIWLKRVTIDAVGVCSFGIFGRHQIAWDEIESVEYPWRVPGKYAWAYNEYARIKLKTGKMKDVAIAGNRLSRILRDIMK